MAHTAPSPEQVDAVQEIAQLYSFDQTENLLGILNDAQWAATLADITEWGKVKNKHTIIKGNGVEINKDRNRLDITIRLRRRLKVYPADPNELNAGGGSYCSYTPASADADCCRFE